MRTSALSTQAREPLGLPPLAVLALMLVAGLATAMLSANPYANPDAHAFEALARSLLAGRGLSYREPMLPWLQLFAFRSPGYPVFLAGGLALGGVRLALALNGALVAWTAVQVGELVARVSSRRTGVLALVLALLWPLAWITAGELMSETLFVALSATAMRIALDAMAADDSGRRIRLATLAGVLSAACILTRPVGLAILVAATLGLVLRSPRAALACLVACALAYAPWPLRNLRVLGEPVPFTTSAGLNLCDGVTPGPVSDLWTEMAGWRPLGELALDRRWRERYSEVVHGNPRSQVLRSARELVHFVVPLEREPQQLLHRAVSLLALVGMALVAGTPAGAALTVAWLGQGAINALTQVNARYRFPSEWLVVVFAALAVDMLRRRLGERRARLATGVLLGLGLAAAIAQMLKHAR